MTEPRHVVVRRGGRYVVLREDNPESTGGVIFPATESETSYERARRFADACNEEKSHGGQERVR